MSKMLRNTFLATTAAAALVTGMTIASAQQSMGGGGMGGGGSATTSGSGGTERHQGASGGSMGRGQSSGGSLSSQGHQTQNTRTETERQPSSPGRSGKITGEDRNEKGKALGEQKTKQLGTRERGEQLGRGERNERLGTKHGETTERFGRGERNERLGTSRGETTERFGRGERNERFGTSRTDRGFAREHTNVQLNSSQRTRIHDVFVRDRARFDRFRVSSVDFDVRPGVRIPRHVHLFAVPTDIVEVVPAYRGYRFFYWEDELVIVDPVTLEIVAVIPA